MKNTLQRYWLVVAVLWVGALVLTYLNVQTVSAFRQRRQAAETLRMDDRFVKANFNKITRVLQQRARLHKPVESLQLALLELESRLKTLAAAHQLALVEIRTGREDARLGGMDIQLKLEGAVPDAVGWLNGIEEQHPYLPLTRVRLTRSENGRSFQLDVSLVFRFVLERDTERG